jgi:transcriptional regulator with XRE-family HTH domain
VIPHRRRASDRPYSGPLCQRIKHARKLSKLSQAALANELGVRPSAVAQWELPKGTFPTLEHLSAISKCLGVSFEWLATGRGGVGLNTAECPAISTSSFAMDEIEDRLLAAFRCLPSRKRDVFVRWMEDFL